eukprot:1401430-Pleurochrysis_carterae.AAC.1
MRRRRRRRIALPPRSTRLALSRRHCIEPNDGGFRRRCDRRAAQSLRVRDAGRCPLAAAGTTTHV